MGFSAAIVDFASPGSSGTVDVTSSGFGTPQAAMVWGTHAPDSTVPNRATDVNFFIGFWANDGSDTQDGIAIYVEDGVGTMNAQTRVGDGAGILPDAENEIDNMAVVTTAITDGIRIQFNGGYSQRYFALLFNGAADFSLTNFDLRGTSADLSLGHEPHVAFCLTAPSSVNEGTTLSDAGMSLGVLHFDGTTLAQLSTSWAAQDAGTTADNAQVISNAEIGRALSYGSGDPITASRPSADTLRLESVTYGSLCAVLAFELDDPDDFAMGLDREDLHTAPDDDGATQAVTIDTGWDPALVGMIGTRMTATNTWYSGFRSIGICVGADDGTSGHCASWRTQDGQSTERAHSLNEDTIHALYKSNDDAVIDHQASLYSLDSDGFTLAWDDVQTDRPYFIWWAVRTAATTTVTGTGAGAAQDSSISGTGVREITSSGAVDAEASTLAAAGVIGRFGAGDLSAQACEAAGAGERIPYGSAVLVSQVAGVSGSGSRNITSTAELSSDSSAVAATGSRSVFGTGVLVGQGMALSASGGVSSFITAAGFCAAQPSTVAASGLMSRVAAGAIAAERSSVSGNVYRGINGVADLAAQSSAVAGGGALPASITGSCLLRSASARMSGAGVVPAWVDRADSTSSWLEAADKKSVWVNKADEETVWMNQ